MISKSYSYLQILDFIHPHMSETLCKDLALLTWCMEKEVKIYLGNKQEEALKELEGSLHLARWRNHDLFAKSKIALEEMCKENNLGSDDSKSKVT